MVRHLTRARLITTVKEGCVLTKRGTMLYNSLRPKLSKVFLIDAKQFALDKISAAILIKDAGQRVKRGIEQRDAAIRAGATGACTLLVRKGNYLMPMAESEDWKLPPQDPLIKELQFVLRARDNDVVTIVSAPHKELAEHGAVAAALTFLK